MLTSGKVCVTHEKFCWSFSVPEKIESTRKSGGGGEVVTKTTLYQETHHKGGVQRHSSTISSQGRSIVSCINRVVTK
jgi:hypothetical protein